MAGTIPAPDIIRPLLPFHDPVRCTDSGEKTSQVTQVTIIEKQRMILLELFSGIGGFSKGFEKAGYPIEQTYFSEIDKHAIANFKYNFPHARHIGLVEKITTADIPHPDILTFGSPCQDFSVLGKGAGMEGRRSSLISYAIEAVRHFRPDVFIWENVKGVLFAKHRADLFAILKAFVDIGGYRLEWQLLNTSWFLPQNRERIYLVGRLAERCAGSVFPIGEGCSPDATGRQNKSVCSATITRNYSHQGNFTNYLLDIPGDKNTILPLCHEHYKKVRMLTPVECERLQGFPDDFTRLGNYDGEIRPIPLAQRYCLLGNAVSVPTVEAVASRIKNNTILD